MFDSSQNDAGCSSNNSFSGNPMATLDRVDTLVSALVDDVITDHEVRELGVMLENEPTARQRYIEDIQLHCQLTEHFASEAEKEASDKPKKSPVLGFLGGTSDSGISLPNSLK